MNIFLLIALTIAGLAALFWISHQFRYEDQNEVMIFVLLAFVLGALIF